MAEWLKAAVLKTVVPSGTGGSNPSLSAKTDFIPGICFFYCVSFLITII